MDLVVVDVLMSAQEVFILILQIAEKDIVVNLYIHVLINAWKPQVSTV